MTVAFPAGTSLSPVETAGQLVCVPLRDYRGDPGAREAFLRSFDRHGWGGVIVFGGDLASATEILADDTGIELLIARLEELDDELVWDG